MLDDPSKVAPPMKTPLTKLPAQCAAVNKMLWSEIQGNGLGLWNKSE
jgi:hypothetical protein